MSPDIFVLSGVQSWLWNSLLATETIFAETQRPNWRSKTLIDCAREKLFSQACVVGSDFHSLWKQHL